MVQPEALGLLGLEYDGIDHQGDVANQLAVVERQVGGDGVALLQPKRVVAEKAIQVVVAALEPS